MTPTPFRCLGALLFLLAGCARTEIVVSVVTDLAADGAIDRVEITVQGPGSRDTRTASLAPDAATQPVTLTLRGADATLVDVTAVGYRGAEAVVTRRARARFVQGRVLALPLALLCGCGASQCGTGTECSDSVCPEGMPEPSALSDWTGPFDATAGVCHATDAASDAPGADTMVTDAAIPDGGSGPLGRTTIGALAGILTVDHSRATPVTPATTVTALRLAAYVDGFGSDAGVEQDFRGVIYAGGGPGDSPGAVHCRTVNSGVNAMRSPGWLEIALMQPCTLQGGQTYFLGVHSGGPAPVGRIYYDESGEPTLWFSTEDSFADGTGPFVVQERDNRLISIHAIVAAP